MIARRDAVNDWFFFPVKKNKKKTDPNPPVWTGLNEKIDI